MRQRRGYNPKRKIAPVGSLSDHDLKVLSTTAKYGGNPEHKKSPGDYQLTPPAQPRPGKTLCDARGPLPKGEAEALLRAGFGRGLVSEQRAGAWPQNVWSVGDDGTVFEAQLENRETGSYHGYPLPQDDRFRAEVVKEWEARAERTDDTR